jgi:CBS domain-containing protein
MIRRDLLEAAAARGDAAQTVARLLDQADPAVPGTGDEFPHLHPDHSLSLALERLGAVKQNTLPVVSRASMDRLLGVISLRDILAAYGVANDDAGPSS